LAKITISGRYISLAPVYGLFMEELPVADEIRLADETAYRALALFSVIAVALGADRIEIIDWLKQNDLWDRLAASELEFLDSARQRGQIQRGV
jgi:hypothetical protein